MLGLLSPPRPLDDQRTLRWVDALTGVTVGIGALEELSRPRDMDEDGLMSWRIRRTSWSARAARRIRPVLALSGSRWDRVNTAVRLGAATVALVAPRNHPVRAGAAAATAGAMWLKSFRSSFGSDGSDQVVFLSSAVGALARAPFLRPQDRRRVLGFLGVQSVMSYAVAGIAKAISPQWRDGSALPGIMRTQTYGDRGLYEFLKRHPKLSKAGCWMVIVAECGTPIVLIAPPWVRRGYLAMLAGFHVGNARFMGLNRFLWAFVGTYPAVDHLAGQLRAEATA